MTQIGADHIVFGLDFPYKSAQYVRDAIGIVRALAIADRDKVQILGGTLRGLLQMDA